MMVEDEVRMMVEEAIASDPSLFLVGIKLKGHQGNQKLIVWLDGDQGVTIDQCAKVSRVLSEKLEELDLIEGKYQLEVSSAGIDHPLQSVRQYRKNIGRSLKIMLKDGGSVSGELVEVTGDQIRVLEKEKKAEKEHVLNFEEIDSSKVLVSFK